MAVRALAGDGEKILNTETYVSSALGFNVQAFLPVVNAGAGGTASVDDEIRVETTAGGSVELLTAKGRRVGIVPSRSQAVVVARTGVAQTEDDDWNFDLRAQTPKAVVAAAGATYTAAEQGLLNAIRTCLIDNGLMKAE